MEYRYNGNLSIEERIYDVCNDIRSEYSGIPLDKLRKIAVLEGPIIDEVNNKMKFKRLYNMLLVISNDISLSNTYDKVVSDLLHIFSSMDDEEIDNELGIVNNILRFKNNSGEKLYVS